jgi:hypothetical protein
MCDVKVFLTFTSLCLALIFGKKATHNDSTKKVFETDIITMLEFFIDNVLVTFDGCAFQQKIVNLMLTFSQT